MDENLLDEEIATHLRDFLKRYRRKITEEILTDILCGLYFLDCNKPCNYENMTAEEVVKIYNENLNTIEKTYDFDLAQELNLFGSSSGDEDY